jgi:prevent-host-death family protein
MERLKTVGIRKLKNSLSAYLKEVQNGVVLIVTDHGKSVAEIRTPQKEYDLIKIEKLKQEWIDSNKIRLPVNEKNIIHSSPVTLPEGTSSRLLYADRQEGQ